ERSRCIQKNAQRHQVDADRGGCLEVLRSEEFFVGDAVDCQPSEADAPLSFEQFLRIGKISEARVCVSDICELYGKAGAEVILGKACAEVRGEANVKGAALPTEEPGCI